MAMLRSVEPCSRIESTALLVDDGPPTVAVGHAVAADPRRVPGGRVVTADAGVRIAQACRTGRPAVVPPDLLLIGADGIDGLEAQKAIDRGILRAPLWANRHGRAAAAGGPGPYRPTPSSSAHEHDSRHRLTPAAADAA